MSLPVLTSLSRASSLDSRGMPMHRRVSSAPQIERTLSAGTREGRAQISGRKEDWSRSAISGHTVRRSTSTSSGAADLPFPPPLTRADVERMNREDDVNPRSRPFPPPPTLADIRRMEPHLSPASMRRRASDCPDFDVEGRKSFASDSVTVVSSEAAFPVVEEVSPIAFAAPDFIGGETKASLPPVGYGRPSKGSPVQDEAPVAKSVADPKKEQRKALQAIAEWIVDYMYGMTRDGRLKNPSAPSGLPFSRSQTLYRISNILLSSLVPLPVPFLALWYISRLAVRLKYPVGSKADAIKRFSSALCGGGLLSTGELITRMFVAGIALADWWLDDNTFAVKTWRDLSFVPSKVIHQMEIAAFDVLDFKLRVPSSAWVQFLESIRSYNQAVFRLSVSEVLPPSFFVGRTLNSLLDSFHLAQTTDEPQFLARVSVSTPPVPAVDLKRKRELDSDVDRDDGRGVLSERGLESEDVSDGGPSRRKKLPAPSEWTTESDPVVYKPRRTMGLAIGPERVMATIREEGDADLLASKRERDRYIPPGFVPFRPRNNVNNAKTSHYAHGRLYTEEMRFVPVAELHDS